MPTKYRLSVKSADIHKVSIWNLVGLYVYRRFQTVYSHVC